MVADMTFYEICTAHIPVCLCLIASGLVFVNGKRLHHRSWKSRIVKKKYYKIWDKVSNSIKKGFHSKYNVPWIYLNTKTKSFRVKTNTHFHGNGMPKEGSPCISLSMTLIYFVFKTGKNFYPQVFLEECKYI